MPCVKGRVGGGSSGAAAQACRVSPEHFSRERMPFQHIQIYLFSKIEAFP